MARAHLANFRDDAIEDDDGPVVSALRSSADKLREEADDVRQGVHRLHTSNARQREKDEASTLHLEKAAAQFEKCAEDVLLLTTMV